jgi:hypothetical protein
MKTKFQSLACLALAIVMLSTKAFAGDPTSNGTTTKGDNTTTVAVTHNTDNTDNSSSILSYHHGGGSSGGAFEGKNIIGAGVGFLGGIHFLVSIYTIAGYTVSGPPTICLYYERGLSQHWGVGFIFNYSSATLTAGSQQGGGYIDYSTGKYIAPYTYTDKYTITGLGFGVTGAYHFTASDKFDPYIGLALGYTSIKFKATSDDPYYGTASDPNFYITLQAGGVLYGGFLGARFYFTNNIGAWASLGYLGWGGALINAGLAFKF